MGSLLTCTSTNRPSAIKGDVYFEVDTQRLVVYNGNYWLNYSPSGSGAIVDRISAVDPLQIRYVATLDEMLSEPAAPGDMFLVDRQPAKARIIFDPERILNSDNNFAAPNGSQIKFYSSNPIAAHNYRYFQFRTDNNSQLFNNYTRLKVYDEDKFNIRGITGANWQGLYYLSSLINQEDNGTHHSGDYRISSMTSGHKFEIIDPNLTDYIKIGANSNTAGERFIYNGEVIDNYEEIQSEYIKYVNTSLHGLFDFEISGEFNNILTIIDSSEFWRSRPLISWSSFTNTVHLPNDEDYSTPPNITIEQFSAKKDYQLIFFAGLNQYTSLLNLNNN